MEGSRAGSRECRDEQRCWGAWGRRGNGEPVNRGIGDKAIGGQGGKGRGGRGDGEPEKRGNGETEKRRSGDEEASGGGDKRPGPVVLLIRGCQPAPGAAAPADPSG